MHLYGIWLFTASGVSNVSEFRHVDFAAKPPYIRDETERDRVAMADFGLTSGADALRTGQAGEPMKISFSRNAMANLALRSISVDEVRRALHEGEVVSTDAGHYVIKLDDEQGGIRVMADKEGDSVIVRTAVRPDELLANAG